MSPLAPTPARRPPAARPSLSPGLGTVNQTSGDSLHSRCPHGRWAGPWAGFSDSPLREPTLGTSPSRPGHPPAPPVSLN